MILYPFLHLLKIIQVKILKKIFLNLIIKIILIKKKKKNYLKEEKE